MGATKQKSGVVVGKPEPRRLPHLPKWVVPMVLGILILIAGWLLYQHHRSDEKKAQLVAETVCETSDNGNILKEAAANLSPSKSASLLPVVQKIQKLKMYQQDPNCLYIIVTYYTNIGNGNSAATYLAKFNKVYTSRVSLSFSLVEYASVQAMRNNVTFLQTVQKQNQNDMSGIHQP